MGELKPLGSEKLQGDEKIKRILELANYNINSHNTKKVNAEFISEEVNGHVYGIIREKDGYYVKKGLNENTLDYIGGMFNKNKNRFKSYAEALKRLNLISGQELNEAKRYVLKQNKPQNEMPMDEPAVDDMPPPAEDVPPAPETDTMGGGEMDAPLGDGMGNENEGFGDLENPGPEGDAMDEPIDEPGMEEDPMGGEGEETKRSSYMEEIQKFSGKLGQELRDQKERLESDDIKYVLNMIISAINLDSLDDEDLDDIADKFKRNAPMDDELSPEMEPEPETELAEDEEFPIDPDLEQDPNPEMEPGMDDEFEPQPEPQGSAPSGEEVIKSLADLNEFGEFEGGSEFDDFKDTSMGDEEIELDLDEIKKEINASVNDTLSKYFK
jgi:hypothetical protein